MSMPLTPADLHKLEHESRIDAATAQAFSLTRVTSHEGKESVGRSDSEDYSGIVFPIYWPGDVKPREHFLRRDHPPIENGKPKGKYLAPPGRGNKLLFGPHESPESLTDVHLPILLVEGLKKLCAAYRLSRYDREHLQFLPCAISGVWNWKGMVGKKADASGVRVDEKGVIPDFDRITWTGRVVVIVFDSDCQTNEKVAAARRGLVAELKRRGARVAIVDLPALEGRDITGLDDFLAQRGPEEALKLISNSILAYKTDPSPETNFHPVSAPDLLANPPQAVEWVVEDYLPIGSLILMAGKPKEGKTTLIYEVVVKVAQGQPALGRQSRQGGVLILAVEEREQDVQMRLHNLGADLLHNLYVHVGPSELNPTVLDQIKQFVRDNQISLIVVDTLANFWRVQNENDASEVTQAIKPLLLLSRESGACVLLIHHARKSDGQYGDEIRGSGALFAAVDVALILKRHNVQTQRLLQAQSRYPETPSELVLELRETGYVALGDPASIGKSAKLTKLTATLSDQWEGIPQIAKRAGLSRRETSTLLHLLFQDGKALQDGKGVKGAPFLYRKNSILATPKSLGADTNTNSPAEETFVSGDPPSPPQNGNALQEPEAENVTVASTTGEVKAVSEEVVDL